MTVSLKTIIESPSFTNHQSSSDYLNTSNLQSLLGNFYAHFLTHALNISHSLLLHPIFTHSLLVGLTCSQSLTSAHSCPHSFSVAPRCPHYLKYQSSHLCCPQVLFSNTKSLSVALKDSNWHTIALVHFQWL